MSTKFLFDIKNDRLQKFSSDKEFEQAITLEYHNQLTKKCIIVVFPLTSQLLNK